MEIKTSYAAQFHLPEEILTEYYCPQLAVDFFPKAKEKAFCSTERNPFLISVDLYKVLDWLHGSDLPKPLEKEVCTIPVLLYVPDFSSQHLLFHYDGTPESAHLIKKFIHLFANLIQQSKATIISPSFIPKSKIREEQEIIQLVSQATQETSFIKFNFTRIGDFWSYAVKHSCTLLVTTKNYQADLAKVLFHFYKGSMWSAKLSFYLSV
ncbi:hypothetical protein [Algoriphagus sp.]|uniref:hypothetical protein n=1 Tax=Algoriphagus sp. TaxID=1872435 RepID=UPI00260FBDE7|nr:hypothetical protein [Algoriphagus sp.]